MSATTLDPWSDEEGITRAVALLTATFGETPDGVWAAPGRVNLIGEHVDYNAGLCLPTALPHRTYAAVRARTDGQVRLVSAHLPDQPWTGTVADLAPDRAQGWTAYAGGPAWVLADEGVPVTGFDAAIDSCVPFGAGLSSSAAIEGAVAVALAELAGLTLDEALRARLARICVRAENEVAHAPTGGLDQAASLRAHADHGLLIDFVDESVRHVPLDLAAHDLQLLVIDTRAPHTLNDGQYAARRSDCDRAAALLGVRTLRQVGDLTDALSRLDDPVLVARVRHVVTEIERVRQVVALLAADRVRAIGPVLDASHASLRDDYQVTCAELDVSVEAARSAGALGARMTGGGFGGSAIALVPRGRVEAVAVAVQHAFTDRGWRSPVFLPAPAAAGAARVG
ncbi:MAG: galactokinase [Actinobacteria bacterium]|nr:galactokinase [Actinomycetota bacterium]